MNLVSESSYVGPSGTIIGALEHQVVNKGGLVKKSVNENFLLIQNNLVVYGK